MLSAAFAALSLAPAFADDNSDIEQVVVTATRTEQPAAKTGESISVITDQDLQATQKNVVSDALAQTPGVIIVRGGGVGQTATVSLRGAEAGQSVLLIDGVRLNDPSSVDNEAILGDVLVNSVNRIEVLRGPQSTLYGSDAIGGVVNIITKRGGDGFNGTAQAEGGSFDTYHANVGVNGTEGIVEYGAAVNYFHSNGISAADERDGNHETDGYTNLGATLNTRTHINDWLSLDLRGYLTNARDDFDGFPPPTFSFQDDSEYGKDKYYAGYAGLNADLLNGMFHNRIAVAYGDSDRRNYDPTQPLPLEFYAKGKTATYEYQGVVDFSATDQLTFGAEDQRNTINTASPNVFDPSPVPLKASIGNDGYYAQMQSTFFNQLTLTGGARYDDNDAFGSHTSIKLAAAWQIPDSDTTLHANYGDGFKAPTLYELYSEFSNPDRTLSPETAHGWEIGADQSLLDGRLKGSLTYFERRTKNEIDFFDCFGITSSACALRPFGYYDNIDQARARGVEMGTSWQALESLAVSANATWLDDIDASTHADLARRPHWEANGDVRWQVTDTISLGATVNYVGDRFDAAGQFNPLPSYTLFNIYGAYKFSDQYELFARVENVFDRKCQPVAGYGAPGTGVYAGIRAAF
jgi:vitamin B12 transporter